MAVTYMSADLDSSCTPILGHKWGEIEENANFWTHYAPWWSICALNQVNYFPFSSTELTNLLNVIKTNAPMLQILRGTQIYIEQGVQKKVYIKMSKNISVRPVNEYFLQINVQNMITSNITELLTMIFLLNFWIENSTFVQSVLKFISTNPVSIHTLSNIGKQNYQYKMIPLDGACLKVS